MLRASIYALFSLAAYAHGVWIVGPEQAAKGQKVRVEIRHGHKFPEGEEVPNGTGLKLFVVEGQSTRELTVRKGARSLEAEFEAKGGALRYYAVQDRGVMSRTPAGVKPGGRTENKDATETYRSVRVIQTANPDAPKPVDIVVTRKGGNMLLQVRREGKPVGGATIAVFAPGKDETEIGKSGADGTLAYALPAGYQGPLLFSATVRQKQAGSNYDEDRLAAFVSLNVR